MCKLPKEISFSADAVFEHCSFIYNISCMNELSPVAAMSLDLRCGQQFVIFFSAFQSPLSRSGDKGGWGEPVATGDCCASSLSGSGSCGDPRGVSAWGTAGTGLRWDSSELSLAHRTDQQRKMFSVAVRGTGMAGDLINLDSSWHDSPGVYKWSIECSALAVPDLRAWCAGHLWQCCTWHHHSQCLKREKTTDPDTAACPPRAWHTAGTFWLESSTGGFLGCGDNPGCDFTDYDGVCLLNNARSSERTSLW